MEYRGASAIHIRVPGRKLTEAAAAQEALEEEKGLAGATADKQNTPMQVEEEEGEITSGYGILMDCAEGTYGQLVDHFNSAEEVARVLRELRVIFLTHLHADHHLGAARILYERDMLMR